MQKIKTMCNKITCAIDEYLDSDKKQEDILTVQNISGDKIGEFINNRFNNVR